MRICLSDCVFTKLFMLVFIQVGDLLDQATLKTRRNFRIIFVKWMVYYVFSNEFGPGWNFTFRTGHQEVKDLFDLITMLLLVILSIHELSYQRDHSWETKLFFTFQNLMDVKLLVILFQIFVVFNRLGSDVIRISQ